MRHDFWTKPLNTKYNLYIRNYLLQASIDQSTVTKRFQVFTQKERIFPISSFKN